MPTPNTPHTREGDVITYTLDERVERPSPSRANGFQAPETPITIAGAPLRPQTVNTPAPSWADVHTYEPGEAQLTIGGRRVDGIMSAERAETRAEQREARLLLESPPSSSSLPEEEARLREAERVMLDEIRTQLPYGVSMEHGVIIRSIARGTARAIAEHVHATPYGPSSPPVYLTGQLYQEAEQRVQEAVRQGTLTPFRLSDLPDGHPWRPRPEPKDPAVYRPTLWEHIEDA